VEFDAFLNQAWHDHADDPAGVAARLQSEAAARVTADAQLARLVSLVHHVWGEHLGRWEEGLAALDALAELEAATPAGEGVQTLRRCRSALCLSAGYASALDELDISGAVRARALAATNLSERDSHRAALLLDEADAAHEAAALPATDAATRALAVAGWNIACTLEARAERSAGQRALMIRAAELSRRHWARAGGWLEVERCEYRLAITCLQAGEQARAQRHARQCLDIVRANDGPALERFFAWEALARVAHALCDDAGHAHALAAAREAYAGLEEADRVWVEPSLAAIEGR